MYGIVSLLDSEHDTMIESIWKEFKARFGVHGVHRTPVAHFSYHVAQRYDESKLDALLRPIVREVEPFTVRTNGLGIFTGENPVLYVTIGCSEALCKLHRRLWEPMSSAAFEPHPLYHPARWVPHITLAEGDIDHTMLPDVIRLLSRRNFYWEIKVDNVVLLGSEDGVHQVQARMEFGG